MREREFMYTREFIYTIVYIFPVASEPCASEKNRFAQLLLRVTSYHYSNDQPFCLQMQLYLSFSIICISLPLKWIFVKLRKETEGYSSSSQSGGTLIRDIPIYESCHQGAAPALICARGGDKTPCTGSRVDPTRSSHT